MVFVSLNPQKLCCTFSAFSGVTQSQITIPLSLQFFGMGEGFGMGEKGLGFRAFPYVKHSKKTKAAVFLGGFRV